MKSQYLTVSLLFFLCFSIKAENRVYERVYVHTDKDCYIAGEIIWLKFYVIDRNFQPSGLSKVGYVEICDTEKPGVQFKVALEKGSGAGKIKIPTDLPSGIYLLSGYTRYMRNEGENVFFQKQIAVVNAEQQTFGPKRFELVENNEYAQSADNIPADEKNAVNVSVKTDQNEYGNRKKVLLSLDNIPSNTADLVVSVTGNDTFARVSKTNHREWLKQVADTFPFSRQWIPEYEGHIISGRFVPESQEQMLSSVAFVGNDIRYIAGQKDSQNGTINFYTARIFGKQQIVTSSLSLLYYKTPYRVDLLTPFCESVPDRLPVLQIYSNSNSNENQLLDRYIGVQIQEKMSNDSLAVSIQSPDYCTFQPVLSYDLDEYTRFSTISETILEFVNKVRVSKVGGNRRIKVYMNEKQEFNPGNTLVLLDGIPVYDHEDILRYNPMYIKKINIYDENYLFGGEPFECIVSFVTREADLPFFQLSAGSQLYNYECPQLPLPFNVPDYSDNKMPDAKKPDFRHTLYWNPFVEPINGRPVNLSFYTSDLCGEFKVTVEGITTDGKAIRGTSCFQVPAPSK